MLGVESYSPLTACACLAWELTPLFSSLHTIHFTGRSKKQLPVTPNVVWGSRHAFLDQAAQPLLDRQAPATSVPSRGG